MLDTGSSLSFISTRLFQCLPKSIMKRTSFNAQMANGSALAVKKCCILSFKLLHGSHPDMTCRVKFCAIRLPPQVDMLLGAPFHRDHRLQLDWEKRLVIFPHRSNRPAFSRSPPQYGPHSHLTELNCRQTIRRDEPVFACFERPLAGGEGAPPQSLPLDSLPPPRIAQVRRAANQGDFVDVFSECEPKASLHKHIIDLVTQ